LLALTVVTPVCAQTQALKTVRYTIFLDNGVVAGEQIVERPNLDTIDFLPALKNGDSYGVNLGMRSIASVGSCC